MPSRATYHLWRAAEEMDWAADVVEAANPESLIAKDLRLDADSMRKRRETVVGVPDLETPEYDGPET